MSLSDAILHTLTGLTYGMLFFLIAVGLSIILGVMNIVNLAHGSFFMLGSYIAFSLLNRHIGFWVALILAVIMVAIFGLLMEKFLLKKIYGKQLEQVLLTFGVTFIMVEAIKWVWGADMFMFSSPSQFDFLVTWGSIEIPAYRLFVVVIGCVIAVILWYFESRTRIGAIIRAGVDDKEMVSSLGINVGVVFTGVFAFGAGLAAFGGVLGAPILGLYPAMGFEVLITSLIVVVIGGLGSWKGSFVAAILIGLVETWGKVLTPSFTMVIVFLLMFVVLMIKPSGLFGRRGIL